MQLKPMGNQSSITKLNRATTRSSEPARASRPEPAGDRFTPSRQDVQAVSSDKGELLRGLADTYSVSHGGTIGEADNVLLQRPSTHELALKYAPWADPRQPNTGISPAEVEANSLSR